LLALSIRARVAKGFFGRGERLGVFRSIGGDLSGSYGIRQQRERLIIRYRYFLSRHFPMRIGAPVRFAFALPNSMGTPANSIFVYLLHGNPHDVGDNRAASGSRARSGVWPGVNGRMLQAVLRSPDAYLAIGTIVSQASQMICWSPAWSIAPPTIPFGSVSTRRVIREGRVGL
jgi:hypothetical protein